MVVCFAKEAAEFLPDLFLERWLPTKLDSRLGEMAMGRALQDPIRDRENLCRAIHREDVTMPVKLLRCRFTVKLAHCTVGIV